MANTFELIASSTVGSGGVATISFTSIPSTYTDLCVKLSLRNDNAATYSDALGFQFNSSTSGYTQRYVFGYASTASSGSNATLTIGASTYGRIGDSTIPGTSQTASTFSNTEFYVPNYLSSNNKSWSADTVGENNSSGNGNMLDLAGGLWSNTAAVTSITFAPSSGSFVQYSTAYLYGIKNS